MRCVVEVEPAGQSRGFVGCSDVMSAAQDGVFVAVAAGEVDGEAPPGRAPKRSGNSGRWFRRPVARST